MTFPSTDTAGIENADLLLQSVLDHPDVQHQAEVIGEHYRSLVLIVGTSRQPVGTRLASDPLTPASGTPKKC